MKASELIKAVWELIDDESAVLCQEDYLEFLQDLQNDAAIRAEAVQEEIEEERNRLNAT